MKMICFDMDGTIADLYGQEGWLEDLVNENPRPYILAEPLYDMTDLNMILLALANQGWEIRVISWLAMDSSESFKEAVRQAKIDWLKRYNFPCSHVHLVQYGTTKADCVRRAKNCETAILVDDNELVRNGWHLGKTINPLDGTLLEDLKNLLI